MAGEIGSAFVRIRPNTAGFQAEAEQGIKGALVGVGKIVGGIFAAQTFVSGIKDIAAAAAQHQAAFAVLNKTIEDAGASTKLLGTDIEHLLEKESRLKGFHDEDLASSFTRLVSVSHDSAKAFRELGLAEDVARARHIDVATAALALARAEQGSTISLSRLGIIIPKVSDHVAALRKEHDLAVASGVKFNGQLGFQYKQSLAVAAAADRQATKVAALDVVQKRFGGTAAVFGKSALGEFQTFQAQLHQFEVAVGGALLPSLTGGAANLGNFIQRLTASGQAAGTAKQVMAELGQIVHVLAQALQVAAPPALAVGHALLEITQSLGIPGLLIAVGIYKGLGLALSGAGGAATRFRAVLAAGTAAQEAAAAGANSTVAAEHAYASAIRLGTAAQEASIAPTEAATAAINLNAAARERAALVGVPTAAATVRSAPRQSSISATSSATDAAQAIQAHAAALDIVERGTTKATASENALAAATVKDTAANRANLASSRQAAAGQAALGEAAARTNVLQIASARGVGRSAQLGNTLITDEQRAAATQSAVFKARLALVAASQAFNPPSTQRVGPTPEFQAAQAGILAKVRARLRAEREVEAALTTQGAAAAKAAESENLLTASMGRNTAASAASAAASARAVESETTLAAATARDTAVNEANAASIARVAEGQLALGGAAAVSGGGIGAAGAAFAGFNKKTEEGLQATRGFGFMFKGISEESGKASGKLFSLAGAMGGLRAAGAAAGTGVKALGSGILALIGGPTTLAIAALAALGFGIFRLVTQETAAQIAGDHLRDSIQRLAGALSDARASARQYADAISSIKTDRIAVASARLALEQARQQLSSTQAARGSLEYRQALQAVSSAQDSYRLALRQVTADEKAASDAHAANARNFGSAEDFRRKSLADTLKLLHESNTATTGFLGKVQAFFNTKVGPIPGTKITGLGDSSVGLDVSTLPNREQAAKRFADGIHKTVEALKEQHPFLARQLQDIELVTRALRNTPTSHVVRILVETGSANAAIRELVREQESLSPSVTSFVAKLRAEADAISSSDPVLSRRIGLLADYATAVRQFPSEHTTNLVLHAPSFKAATNALIKELKDMDAQAKAEGNKAAADYAEAFIARLQSELGASIVGTIVGLAALPGKARAAAIGIAGESTKSLKAALKLVDGEISQTQTTIQAATTKLADAQKTLADAIRTGNQQIHDSIESADANLASIGDSISNMLGQFLDAQQKAGIGADISEKEFRRLRAKLEAGQGGVGTLSVAQQVGFQIEKGQSAASAGLQDQKDKAKRGIADLVDEFNRGQITLRQLSKGIAHILSSDGFSYKQAGKLLGSAFVTGFKDELAGITKQAQALLAVPAALRRGINGQEPNIVRPLDTIRTVNDSIAKAERERSKDAKSLEKAEAAAEKERRRQHAVTNELLRRGALTPARPEVARAALKVDLAALNPNFAASKAQLKDIVKLAEEAGIGIPQGLVKGIQRGGPHGGAETRKLAEILLAELKAKLRAKSPSEATREIGQDFGLGLALGIADKVPGVVRATEVAAAKALDAALAATGRAKPRLFAKGETRVVREEIRLERVLHQRATLKALLAQAEPVPRVLPSSLIRQEVRFARVLTIQGPRLRELLSRLEPVPARIPPVTIRQAVSVARALVERPVRELLGRSAQPPPRLPSRVLTEAVELKRILRLPGATIPELVRRAEIEARRELRFAADVPLTLRVGADTASAANHIGQFVGREELRRVSLTVVADTDRASKQLAAFAAKARKVKLDAEASAPHLNPRAPAAAPPKLTIRHEVLPPTRVAVIHPAASVAAARDETGQEMLGELRAQRRTTAHGDEMLLSESRRQTHLLNEIHADARRKPPHRQPSKAPGDSARKARAAANHNLTP